MTLVLTISPRNPVTRWGVKTSESSATVQIGRTVTPSAATLSASTVTVAPDSNATVPVKPFVTAGFAATTILVPSENVVAKPATAASESALTAPSRTRNAFCAPVVVPFTPNDTAPPSASVPLPSL